MKGLGREEVWVEGREDLPVFQLEGVAEDRGHVLSVPGGQGHGGPNILSGLEGRVKKGQEYRLGWRAGSGRARDTCWAGGQGNEGPIILDRLEGRIKKVQEYCLGWRAGSRRARHTGWAVGQGHEGPIILAGLEGKVREGQEYWLGWRAGPWRARIYLGYPD